MPFGRLYGWVYLDVLERKGRMTIKLNGEIYYRPAEACRIAGISKNTLLRWIKGGSFSDAARRDRRGWRLFTKIEVDKLKDEVNTVQRGAKHSTQKILASLE